MTQNINDIFKGINIENISTSNYEVQIKKAEEQQKQAKENKAKKAATFFAKSTPIKMEDLPDLLSSYNIKSVQGIAEDNLYQSDEDVLKTLQGSYTYAEIALSNGVSVKIEAGRLKEYTDPQGIKYNYYKNGNIMSKEDTTGNLLLAYNGKGEEFYKRFQDGSAIGVVEFNPENPNNKDYKSSNQFMQEQHYVNMWDSKDNPTFSADEIKYSLLADYDGSYKSTHIGCIEGKTTEAERFFNENMSSRNAMLMASLKNKMTKTQG